MQRLFPKTVAVSHFFVKKIVKSGDCVVDATAGNGFDTVFLAELVGEKGIVYSFDIQSEAIERTRNLLQEKKLLSRVNLNFIGHEKMDEKVSKGVSVVMFNLGYLPKGDHSIITKPETTILALEKSLKLLKMGGLVSIVLYTGHLGGDEESRQVEYWAENLDSRIFDVVKIKYINKPNNPPYYIAIQKLYEGDN